MSDPVANHELALYSLNGKVTTVKNPVRIKILHLVQDEGIVPFSRIMEVTGLSKSTISGYITSLSETGLLEQVPCADDARRKQYTLAATYLGYIEPSTYAAASEFRELIRHTYAQYDTIDYKEMLPHIFRVALAEAGISIDPVIRRGGSILGEAVAPYIVADSLEKTITNIQEFWKHYGFGEVKIRSSNPLRLDVYKCYECMTLPKGFKGGCIISRGILSALFSSYYRTEVQVAEVECMTQGFPCCCFEINPAIPDE